MDRVKFIKEKYGESYEIFVKECKRLDIKYLGDNDLVIKGDGKTYVFILRPK